MIRCLAFFVALYPFVVNPFVAPVFTVPKLTFLYIMTATIMAIWALKVVREQRFEVVRTPINVLVPAFFLLTILSTLTSISPIVSFFGQYGRWEGLATTISYMTLALAAANFVDRDSLRTIVRWFLLSASMVAALTIMESIWFNPITRLATVYCAAGFGVSDQNPFGPQRPIAVFGNPDFLAAYLVMAAVLAWTMFIWRPGRDRWMAIVFSAGVLTIVALALTESRSAWLAAAAALAFVSILAIRDRREPKHLAAMFGVILVLITGLSFAQPRLVGRARTLIDPGQAVAERLDVWRSTARMIVARPVLGSGPGTFPLVFPEYALDNLPDTADRAPVDRAHNWLLHQAATTGVAGGLILLVVLAMVTVRGIRSEATGAARAAAIAALAYAIQALVNPTHLSGAAFFWLLVGLSFSRGSHGSVRSTAWTWRMKRPDAYRAVLFTLWLAAVAMALLLMAADVRFNGSLAAAAIGDSPQAVLGGRDSVRLFPYESRYHVNLGEAYVGLWRDDPRPAHLDAARASFARGIAVNKADATSYFRAGAALLTAGRQTRDKALLRQIIVWEKQGLEFRPKMVDAHLDIGVAEAYLGRVKPAISWWKRAAALVPTDARPHVNLGWAYERMGRPRAALAAYRRALELDESSGSAREAVVRLEGKKGVFTERALP